MLDKLFWDKPKMQAIGFGYESFSEYLIQASVYILSDIDTHR